MSTSRPSAPGPREGGTHVNRDGLAKRSFESERAASIEVLRLEQESGHAFDWYRCAQGPEHWHIATVRPGSKPSVGRGSSTNAIAGESLPRRDVLEPRRGVL
jgi:hypothetical protein